VVTAQHAKTPQFCLKKKNPPTGKGGSTGEGNEKKKNRPSHTHKTRREKPQGEMNHRLPKKEKTQDGRRENSVAAAAEYCANHDKIPRDFLFFRLH
jgi:hypothetical protein